MALVTIQRSPSASSSPPSSEHGSSVHGHEDEVKQNRSLSEYYFAVKGFGVLLPKSECQRGRGRSSSQAPADIQNHLQAVLNLLRPGDTLLMAVRLESQHVGRVRYLAVVSTTGRQDTEEECLIGVDFTQEIPTIGLVLRVLADTRISLDGDGGFSISTSGRKHIFKPISVQAMWSALQTLNKASTKAHECHYFLGGINHDWVAYYEDKIGSDQSCINEWHAMDSLESKRPPSPDSLTDKEETKFLIRGKLKEIMTSVDIDEVTSKYIRQNLEEQLDMDLFKFKSFIDQEMLVILGQMDAATEIFPHVYLGSEWNASNLEELKSNRIGFILNVTKEIDNFYPGMFNYYNIRVYDNDETELLKHWDCTYRYINKAKEIGSKVLVHCKMGISRSASVVIAYAMKAYNLTLEEAVEVVKKRRSCINPNHAFHMQLKTYQGILDASRQRHNILWRSKSETNLKTPGLSTDHLAGSSSQKHYAQIAHSAPNHSPESEQPGHFSSDSRPENAFVNGDSDAMTPFMLYSNNAHKRPKSWSPDDHTAHLIFPSLVPDICDNEDLWKRSQSLNDQIWQASVVEQSSKHTISKTYEQDNPIPIIDKEELLVEALNPLYVPHSHCPSPVEYPLLSSVKERINEFESVTTTTVSHAKSKSPVLNRRQSFSVSNHDMSSPDFSCNSTMELDQVIETLLLPDQVVESPNNETMCCNSDMPMSSQFSSECGADSGISFSSVEPNLNFKFPWKSRNLKHLKHDDDQTKIKSSSKSFSKTGSSSSNNLVQKCFSAVTACYDSLSRKRTNIHHTNPECQRSAFYSDNNISPLKDVSLTKGESISDGESKKPIDEVFIFNSTTESSTPSRNNSWGSFDSAVIVDRNMPSRQSSWGSSDTRLTGGTISSRNSSFGAFDARLQFDSSPVSNEQTSHLLHFDKEITSLEADKVIKCSSDEGNLNEDMHSSSEEYLQEDTYSKLKIATNTKIYGPSPFKSPIDRYSASSDDSSSTESSVIHYISTPILVSSCIHPQFTKEFAIFQQDFVEPNYTNVQDMCATNDDGVLYNAQVVEAVLPVEETPAPGIVEQHKKMLEKKAEDNKRLSAPVMLRSLSASCMEVDRKGCNLATLHTDCEGDTTFERESSEGRVKKITQAIEKKQIAQSTARPRSHSLERLSTSPKSCLTTATHILDQLVVEAQAQVKQCEQDAEEISVRNLVGRFEVTQLSKRKHSTLRIKNRPRSDSVCLEKVLPPVPQRKSSLDYSSSTLKTPSRSSSVALQPVVKSFITKTFTGTSRPPSGGTRLQPCGSEVRHKKQHGKTHPLAKLTPRENTTL